MFTSTCPIYPRFRLYNPILGFYDFLVNPSQYTPYPAKLSKVYSTIMDFDPTVDQDYCKVKIEMQWDFMPEQMWMDLEPYFRKNFDGSSLELYLWDWDRFTGARIQVCEFRAGTKGGYSPVDRNNVKLVFRKISNADIYGILANYKFKGNGNDSSLNGNNLTQVGNVPYSIINGAYAAGPFSTSNYFALDKTLLQGRSVWSMVIRFNNIGALVTRQTLFHADVGSTYFSLFVEATSGALVYYYGNGSKFVTIAPACPVGDHTISISYNGTGRCFIWLDANLKSSISDALPVPASLSKSNIGLGISLTGPWLGTISSLRLYSRALTDYELQTPLADNVAYYGMQQSGADWSGQKNHLTTVGNVPYALQSDGTYAAGPFSSANYYTMPAGILCALPAFTIRADYFYSYNDACFYQGWETSAGTYGVQLVIAGDNKLGLWLNSDKTCVASVGVADNNWHRISATYASGTATIYWDGQAVKTQTVTFTPFTDTTQRIGVGRGGGSPTKGAIKRFIVNSRALTAAEIAADYAASFPPALTGSEVAISSTGDELTGDNYDANITKFRNSLL